MGDLVKFPEHRIVRDLPNTEIVAKNKEKGAKAFADKIVESALEDIIDFVENNGFDLDSEGIKKDYIYLSEAIRAMFYRLSEVPHPLHKFIDENITFDDDEEPPPKALA